MWDMLGQEDSKTAFWNELHLHRMQHFCFWIACHVGNALRFFYCILYQMFIAEAHTFSENMLVFGISRILAVNWFEMHCPSQYQNLNTVSGCWGGQEVRFVLPTSKDPLATWRGSGVLQDKLLCHQTCPFRKPFSSCLCGQGNLPTT